VEGSRKALKVMHRARIREGNFQDQGVHAGVGPSDGEFSNQGSQGTGREPRSFIRWQVLLLSISLFSRA